MLEVLLTLQLLCGPQVQITCAVRWELVQPAAPRKAFERVVIGTETGKVVVCDIKNTAEANCYWAEKNK